MGQVHTLYTMILTRCQFLALRYLVLRIDARNVPDHAPEMTLKHERNRDATQLQLMVEPTSLANDGIDQRHRIRQWNAGQDWLGRGDDIAAAGPHHLDAPPRLIPDLLRGSEGQRLLGADASGETEMAAVPTLEREDIHAFRLDRLEHVHTHLD